MSSRRLKGIGGLLACACAGLGLAAPGSAGAVTGLVANNFGLGPLGGESSLANAITEFDPKAFTTGPSITVDHTPTAIAVSPDGTKAYVVDGCSAGCAGLSVVDLVRGVQTSYTPLSVPLGWIAIAPDGGTVYVSGANYVTPVNVAAVPPRPGVSLALNQYAGSGQSWDAISPDGKTVWVSSAQAGEVYPLDTATNTLGPGIATGAGAAGIAVSPDSKTVWVANGQPEAPDAYTVTAIDDQTRTVVRTIPIQTGNPVNLTMTADGGRLFVSLFPQRQVTWIDTATGDVGATLNTGGSAAGAMTLSPDGSTVWVTGGDYNPNPAAVTAVSAIGTPSVQGVVNGFQDPVAVAFSSRDLFVAAPGGAGPGSGGATGGGGQSGTGDGGSGAAGGTRCREVGRARASRTALTVSLAGASTGAPCRFTLSLSTRVRTRRHRLRTVRVGRTVVTLAPTQTETVQVALNAAGRSRLAKRQRLRVRLTIKVLAGGQTRTLPPQGVTFRSRR